MQELLSYPTHNIVSIGALDYIAGHFLSQPSRYEAIVLVIKISDEFVDGLLVYMVVGNKTLSANDCHWTPLYGSVAALDNDYHISVMRK